MAPWPKRLAKWSEEGPHRVLQGGRKVRGEAGVSGRKWRRCAPSKGALRPLLVHALKSRQLERDFMSHLRCRTHGGGGHHFTRHLGLPCVRALKRDSKETFIELRPEESPDVAKDGFLQAGRAILQALMDPLALGL